MKVIPCLLLSAILILGSFSVVGAEVDINQFFELLVEENDEENDEEFNDFESPVLLLGEPNSKEILLERETDKKVYPASITKIMTLLIAMEHIEEGKASMDDEVVISQNAEGVIGTTLFLEKGMKLTFRDLLIGIAVGSANDASVAVAEHISGSIAGFVDEMNQKAHELSMKNTNFKNPHGLHDDDHYTTAEDIFKMSLELLEYENVLEWFQIWMDENYLEGIIGEDGVYLSNTNQLIDWYPDCDGLKTGFTDKAKHGIAATASRNGRRFVAIVLESETSQKRFDEAADLLDYGFSNYEVERVFAKGEKVMEIPVNKGKIPSINAVTEKNLSIVYKRGEDPIIEPEIKIDEEAIDAPLEKGEKLGRVYVEHEGKRTETPIIAEEEVLRATYKDIFKRIIESWVKFGK